MTLQGWVTEAPMGCPVGLSLQLHPHPWSCGGTALYEQDEQPAEIQAALGNTPALQPDVRCVPRATSHALARVVAIWDAYPYVHAELAANARV